MRGATYRFPELRLMKLKSTIAWDYFSWPEIVSQSGRYHVTSAIPISEHSAAKRLSLFHTKLLYSTTIHCPL